MSAWSLGQAWGMTSGVGTATQSITAPGTSVTGRLITLWIFFNGNVTISSVTDNAATPNTYSELGTSTFSVHHNLFLYTAPITSLPTTGNLKITVTLSGNPSSGTFILDANEYNGWNSSSIYDPISLVQDNSTAFIPDENWCTQYTDTLVVAGLWSLSNTLTAGTGFTSRGINASGFGVVDSMGTTISIQPQQLAPFNANSQTPATGLIYVALVASDSVNKGSNPPAASAVPPVNQYARGIFGLASVDSSVSTTQGLPLWTQANMSGYAARFSWAALNPSIGVYNWAPVDLVLALCAQYGKYCSLGISTNAGPSSGISKQPSWLGDTPLGACSQYVYWSANNGKSVPGYAPWDSIFLYYYQQFVQAFGARYNGNPYISYIPVDSGVGDGEAYITKGSNGVAPLNALGGVNIWINAMIQGFYKFYFQAFPGTQIIMITGQPVPGDTTTMPYMLAYMTGQYGSQFGFKSDGLTSNGTPADYFSQYNNGHPLGFQFSNTGSPGGQAVMQTLVNGYLLGGQVSQLGGQFNELYVGEYTDPVGTQVVSLFNTLLFGSSPPIIPPKWSNPIPMTGGGSAGRPGLGGKRAGPFW